MARTWAALGAFIAGLTVALSAQAAPKPKVACADMAGRTVAARQLGLPTGGAKVVSAALKPAEGTPGTPDYAPEHCYIEGAIALQKAMAPIPAEVSKLRNEAYAAHAAAEAAVAEAEALKEAAADLENDSDYLETLDAEISDIDDIVETLTKRRDEVAPA